MLGCEKNVCAHVIFTCVWAVNNVCLGAQKTCVRTFYRAPIWNGWQHQKSKNIRLVRTLSYGARYFRLFARLFFVMYNRMVHDYNRMVHDYMVCLCTIIWYACARFYGMHARFFVHKYGTAGNTKKVKTYV